MSWHARALAWWSFYSVVAVGAALWLFGLGAAYFAFAACFGGFGAGVVAEMRRRGVTS